MDPELTYKESKRQNHRASGCSKRTTKARPNTKTAKANCHQKIEQEFDYLCILDFEATCNDAPPAPKPQEIIEFPTLLLNVATRKIEDTFHYYVRPDVNPTLTPFCTDLTGISQETIDSSTSVSLSKVLSLHQTWLGEAGIQGIASKKEGDDAVDKPKPRFCYVTCGDWDLQTCLPRQLEYHNQKVPTPFHAWINIKRSFSKLHNTKAKGMANMLETLGLKLIGRHHSGIDDCRNIARICIKMLDDGWGVSDSDVAWYEPKPRRLTWREKKAMKKANANRTETK